MTKNKSTKVSFVVGSKGQDGYYLSKLLRGCGYHVIGISRTDTVSSQVGLLSAVDICDRGQVAYALREFKPDEIYYLAAYHHSSESEKLDPYETFHRSNDVHVLGLLNFLDGMERHRSVARLFYATSSHIFGNPASSPQTELTPLSPVCVYGITKAAGVELCRFYRKERRIYCSVGILYNHESPRRPAQFVSRKIVRMAVDIKLGKQSKLELGNLAAAVDWGAAEDYVCGMHKILQLDHPAEFVIASGKLHTIQQFVEVAFSALGLPWEPYVLVDTSLLSKVGPTQPLLGDHTELRKATSWQPAIGFEEMVRCMVNAELNSRQAGVV